MSVAVALPQTAPLPLIYPPDRPTAKQRANAGWRREPRYSQGCTIYELVRHFEDDAYGAEIQHAIARYIVGGESRGACAAALCVGETQFGYMVRGVAWRVYTQPMVRAFKRLGIKRRGGRSYERGGRVEEVSHAALRVLARLADDEERRTMTPRQRREAIADARLLAYGGLG